MLLTIALCLRPLPNGRGVVHEETELVREMMRFRPLPNGRGVVQKAKGGEVGMKFQTPAKR